MGTFFWALEYGKVLFAYVLLMYVWPSVVFRKYLRGKGKVIRFSFCATVPIVVANTVVLGLGLLHILNAWTIRAFFYGTFLWGAFPRTRISEEQQEHVRRLLDGSEGIKLFLLYGWESIYGSLRRELKRFWQKVRPNVWEYGILGVIVLYGVVYFSYGALHIQSYGFGDDYTHHSWIYGLMQGVAFSGNIYPEGMHCFIYSMTALFGVQIYSCLLFVQGIHVSALLVSIYCFLKELFRFRYTAIFVLAVILTVKLPSMQLVYAVSRLQWTLPMEFGLHTMFICALFLVRYLKSAQRPAKEGCAADERTWTKRISKIKEISKIKGIFQLWTLDLFIFSMALAASLAIHTYDTMMAFFLCLPISLCMVFKIFRDGHFKGLVAAVLCGTLIAVAPMLFARASGIPFQGSIGWAIGVMKGEISGDGSVIDEVEQPSQPQQETGPAVTRAVNKIAWILKTIYKVEYIKLYQSPLGDWIAGLVLLGGMLWAVFRSAVFILGRSRKAVVSMGPINRFDSYPPLILAASIFFVLFGAEELHLPELVEEIRVCLTAHVLNIAAAAIPIDMVLSGLARLGGKTWKNLLSIASAASVAVFYAAAMRFGFLHSYPYWELGRYTSVANVTERIKMDFSKDEFTVVSCTDEYYQIIDYGYHEELVSFLRNSNGTSYVLPTKYILIYVEKHPLSYAQRYFFTGPEWLGREPDELFFGDKEIISDSVSEEMERADLPELSNEWDYYKVFDNRIAVESKAFFWCQNFMQRYENEMSVYYEDDDIVCYLIEQNPYRLYQLVKE